MNNVSTSSPLKRRRVAGVSGILSLIALLVACAGPGAPAPDEPPLPFAAYRAQTLDWLRAHRAFQTSDPDAELTWNAPREWRPTGSIRGGVLLVHGLGDSPWSFADIGQQLAEQGFVARTVLLPGHATRPEDMLDVRLRDWQQVVADQLRALREDVGPVYLGGFSTGANLALQQAYADPDVAGLLLFSPAFQSSSPYDWLAPWITWARPWLRQPDGTRPTQNAVRYLTVPTNGFAQFYHSSRQARQALAGGVYDKPTLMVLAQHDSVVDTAATLALFQSRFTHPGSRLVWYGAPAPQARADARVLVRPDALPDWRISQFSHMGLLFSPANPLYGREGTLRICWNGQADVNGGTCPSEATMWFSDWGYQEPGKFHARLTFNPYFDWQGEIMAHVLGAPTRPPEPAQRTTTNASAAR